ncbi:PIN-like domain-containing protein [Gordonia spumicola]|nr:PIN-like domain-containing protein [Gordonia spumicola]
MAANIFSDFFEHSDPDLVDNADTRRRALYAIDANILINLYRYSDDTADQYIRALGQMQSSLFVPHQAIKEFWANRDHVRKGVHHSEAKGKIESAKKVLIKSFREWSIRSNVSVDSTSSELVGGIDEAVAAMMAHIDASSSNHAEGVTDAIIAGLNEAIGDRVGEPPTASQRDSLLAEFNNRVKAGKDTPGAADIGKGDDRSAGDFIFWTQCLDEVQRLRSGAEGPLDLTIVTDEVKEDWVRPSAPGSAKRARLGLVREYYDRTGGTLRLVDRSGILEIAMSQFGADVTDAAREQVDNVADSIGTEWTKEIVESYMNVLWNLGSAPQLKLLIAVAVAVHEFEWTGIWKDDAANLVDRTSLQGFTGAFQTPFKRQGFQDLNSTGVSDPPITLDWSTQSFEMSDDSVAAVIVDVCGEDEDYTRLANEARDWIRSGVDLTPEGS